MRRGVAFAPERMTETAKQRYAGAAKNPSGGGGSLFRNRLVYLQIDQSEDCKIRQSYLNCRIFTN